MIIRDALAAATNMIQPVSDSAPLDAQLLMMEVLGVGRAYLLAHDDEGLTDEQVQRFEAYVSRAARGEPLPYILGRRAFYDLELAVTPDVLIPRPETELLLEQALRFASTREHLSVVDVGTGSGALAVTFAVHCPHAVVAATDISAAALSVALHNAQKHKVNIDFYQGDLLQPLIDHNIKIDLLMANLPYIPSEELPSLAVSQHEPLIALDGGVDGLHLVRCLLHQVAKVCNPAALLLFEIGAGQATAAQKAAQGILEPRDCDVLTDYAGHDRILRVTMA
jgi:release factor glutamine methyltransferase